MTISDKTYDILKWLVQIVLPACATLYAALAALWGFPYVEQIVGTISAICVFLGALLKISSSNYSGDGTLTVGGSSDDSYSVDLSTAVADLATKKSVTLKVNAE